LVPHITSGGAADRAETFTTDNTSKNVRMYVRWFLKKGLQRFLRGALILTHITTASPPPEIFLFFYIFSRGSQDTFTEDKLSFFENRSYPIFRFEKPITAN
jgi:hypothetical protein